MSISGFFSLYLNYIVICVILIIIKKKRLVKWMLKYSCQILLDIALPRKRNGIVPSFLSLCSTIIYAYNEDKNYWLIQVAYREHLYRIRRKNEWNKWENVQNSCEHFYQDIRGNTHDMNSNINIIQSPSPCRCKPYMLLPSCSRSVFAVFRSAVACCIKWFNCRLQFNYILGIVKSQLTLKFTILIGHATLI
jgi:hypothetical protein